MDIKEQGRKSYNYRNNYNSAINHSSILAFIFTLILIFFIVLPFAAKANSKNEGMRENFFYVQVLNNTMPVVKATVFNEDDMAESRFSVKDTVFQFFNLDIKNPISLIKRELAYITPGEVGEEPPENIVNIIFNPFKLNDNDVAIEEEQKLDIPNQTVTVQEPKLKKTLNKSKPEVLIYHTHTSESFMPIGRESLDLTKSIASVGELLARELEENYGISVLHDKTIHDATAYTQSYQRSGVTLDRYLKQYKDLKLIIDLHRDSVENKKAVTTKMNGEEVGKIMFVMSKKNPLYKSNLVLVESLIDISNKLYPGFSRGIYYYNNNKSNHFHQDKNKNAVLIEVGAHTNTLDEARNSAKYLARIIAEQINGKK